jgi:hypothetical protein
VPGDEVLLDIRDVAMWWSDLRASERPGLLPDAALGESAAEIADAIELASRKLYSEAVAERQRQQDTRNQADLAEMKSALDKTHSIRMLKRELHGR